MLEASNSVGMGGGNAGNWLGKRVHSAPEVGRWGNVVRFAVAAERDWISALHEVRGPDDLGWAPTLGSGSIHRN